jgi:hypothetical protein
MSYLSGRTKVLVLSDTHLRSEPDGSMRRWLPLATEPHLEAADVILHAGDLLDGGVLERLRSYAPVYAVLGNNDRDLAGALPQSLLVDLGGVRIGMVHDSGQAAGRGRRLRRRFPDAEVVVFGHSHAPVNQLGEGGQLLFNPGSPTQRRVQPSHSLGELIIDGGTIVDRRIVNLD